MRIVPTLARLALGAAFVLFGANYFLGFLPAPAPEPAAGAFIGALVAGHVLPLAKAVEIAAGVALIGNRFVPLALTLLAPVLVNIVLFHAVFAPAGMALPAVLVALEIGLAWAYRDAFAPMLSARAAPRDASAPRAHAAREATV